MGYAASADAYRAAVAGLTARELTEHYTTGLAHFHDALVPALVRRLAALSGGSLDLTGWRAFGAGSDVDLITHVVEAVAPREGVAIYPGDWHGFRVGCTQGQGISFTEDARGRLATICVPSVRNGHLTPEMLDYLDTGDACLLNINLYPTLSPEERRDTGLALAPILPRSLLSISFSRGFGLTASQLGVLLVPPDHPYLARFEEQWRWLTYFYNAIAARAFQAVDLERLAEVDRARRAHVAGWLTERGLPSVTTGSYYVKTFTVDGPIPERLRPLARDGRVRLCLKPRALT